MPEPRERKRSKSASPGEKKGQPKMSKNTTTREKATEKNAIENTEKSWLQAEQRYLLSRLEEKTDGWSTWSSAEQLADGLWHGTEKRMRYALIQDYGRSAHETHTQYTIWHENGTIDEWNGNTLVSDPTRIKAEVLRRLYKHAN